MAGIYLRIFQITTKTRLIIREMNFQITLQLRMRVFLARIYASSIVKGDKEQLQAFPLFSQNPATFLVSFEDVLV